MSTRRQSRQLALQLLYQGEFATLPPDAALALFCDHFESRRKARLYALVLMQGIAQHRTEIDKAITKHADNWRIERMSLVDRNIMRIAVFELKFSDEVPPGVAIDEAIELAKLFGTDDSPSFINAVLDAVSKE